MKKHFFLYVLLFLGNVSPSLASDPATILGFVPHRAVYEVSLAETRSGSQVTNVSGEMVYAWQPSCEGWSSNHDFQITYEYVDGPAVQVESNFTTFEPFDGKTFQFASQRKNDGQIYEEIRGKAALDDKLKGSAVYTIPEGLNISLPDNTFFPMHHTLQVIEKIKKGDKIYNAVIFDGSDKDGPVEVNAVLGKEAIGMAGLDNPGAHLDLGLLNTKSWSVRLAFFPLNSDQEHADYEMDLTLYENGIVSDMQIEYDDFSVRQELVRLEKLETLCFEDENNNG